MKERILGPVLLLLAAMVLCLSSCQNIKNLRVTSVRLESISPNGLRSLDINVAVGIDNPSLQIGLSEISGSLKHSGKVLGRLAVAPFTVQRRSAEIYHLKANARLAEGAGLKDLMMLTDQKKLYECTVDVSATVTLRDGRTTPVSIKDIPLKKLLESKGNEKN